MEDFVRRLVEQAQQDKCDTLDASMNHPLFPPATKNEDLICYINDYICLFLRECEQHCPNFNRCKIDSAAEFLTIAFTMNPQTFQEFMNREEKYWITLRNNSCQDVIQCTREEPNVLSVLLLLLRFSFSPIVRL